MIWGLGLVAIVAFLLAFASLSAGWMALALVVGFLAGIGAALVFIDRHLRASSRPEHMTEREVEALRTSVKAARSAPGKLPSPEQH